MRFLTPKVLIISVVQIALTVILLVALVRLLDPAKLRQLLQAANPVWLTVGFVILVTQQIISAERWRLVVVALSAPQYRMSFYLFWQGLSMLCSMVLPSIIGADLVRTYALSGRTPIGTVVRIVLIDRALGLLALATLVIVSVLILPRFFVGQPLLLLSVAIAVCGPATYLVLTRLVPRPERLPAACPGRTAARPGSQTYCRRRRQRTSHSDFTIAPLVVGFRLSCAWKRDRDARGRPCALSGNRILRPSGDDHTDLDRWLGDQGERVGHRIWTAVSGAGTSLHLVGDIWPACHVVLSGCRFARDTHVFSEAD